MKRFRRNSPFSLFSFQDIITGLCGIIIFFVLIMLVDLVRQRDAANPAVAEPATASTARAAELQAEINGLRGELAAVRESTKAVIVAAKDRVAPEIVARLDRELSAGDREVAALISQIADLRTRVAAARDADAESRKKVREMEETRRVLEGKLAAMKDRKGVTLIPERGEFKVPVYLVVGKDGLEMLRPLEKSTERKRYSYAEIDTVLAGELSRLDNTTHTVVLLVRPSGAKRMPAIVGMVRRFGLSCGRDPLEEDVEVTLGKSNGERL